MAREYDARLSVQGNGPALVLVPGIDGTGDLFYRQTPRLQQSFRVATYALRDDADDLGALAADLARVVDTAAPSERRAIVVGESFGGAVALTFALRHPERVEALVVLNSFAHFSSRLQLQLAIAGLSIMPWRAMPFMRRLSAFRLHSRHTQRTDMNEFIRHTGRASREGYINRLRLLQLYDVRDSLHTIQRPTLFLASEHDHLVPAVSHARFMAGRVPSSAMRILQGHGHICLIAPDLDLAEILDQWRSEWPGK